jgi:uncharacterized membrane protein YphA (DoxX/SURF4 family)
MKIVNFILRLALGGVFIFAGVVKIINPAGFASDIGNYRVLPHEWINLLAITLPWIEVVAGTLLITGPWKRASALLIAVLLVVFLVGIGQAVARGLNISCGCFGTVEGRKVGLVALAEDIAMLAASAWLVWREND